MSMFFAHNQPSPIVPFIVTVKTDNTGTSATNEMLMPIYGINMRLITSDQDVTVSAPTTLTWAVAGTYEVKVYGMDYIRFNDADDKLKLLTIEQWGDTAFTSMDRAFQGCQNMTGNYTDTPNTSGVSLMIGMFYDCQLFNSPVNFDTSNANTTAAMFYNCLSFNQPVTFNTSNVTTMERMFFNCVAFNQTINFDTALVNDMYAMFYNCTIFNSSVTFSDTSSVLGMNQTFQLCTAFNQPLSINPSSVTTMDRMFASCTNFNQNISAWDVSNVSVFALFMNGVTLSTTNYDALLVAWELLDLVNGLTVDFGDSQYTTTGETAKNIIMIDDIWSFIDKGLAP